MMKAAKMRCFLCKKTGQKNVPLNQPFFSKKLQIKNPRFLDFFIFCFSKQGGQKKGTFFVIILA